MLSLMPPFTWERNVTSSERNLISPQFRYCRVKDRSQPNHPCPLLPLTLHGLCCFRSHCFRLAPHWPCCLAALFSFACCVNGQSPQLRSQLPSLNRRRKSGIRKIV